VREAARAAWESVRAADLRSPPSVLADPRLDDRGIVHRGCTWCRSPWLWGSVGAAVFVGAIVGIVAATASKPVPTLVIDPSQFGAHTASH
jgi:hypothetical protein